MYPPFYGLMVLQKKHVLQILSHHLFHNLVPQIQSLLLLSAYLVQAPLPLLLFSFYPLVHKIQYTNRYCFLLSKHLDQIEAHPVDDLPEAHHFCHVHIRRTDNVLLVYHKQLLKPHAHDLIHNRDNTFHPAPPLHLVHKDTLNHLD